MNERRTQGTRPDLPLRVDEIVAAAIKLIDERGAKGFSIRALANELDVYPTAVYWHVRTRSQLMGLISAAWMSEVVAPSEDLAWTEWLLECGRGYRRAAHAHPEVARLIAGELVNDPAALDLPEAIVRRLVEGGVHEDEIVHVYNAFVAATVGFVDLELARDPSRSDDERRRIEAEIRSLDQERYPHLVAHLDRFADSAFSMRWTPATESPLDVSFEYLITLLMDGVARRAEGARDRRPAD